MAMEFGSWRGAPSPLFEKRGPANSSTAVQRMLQEQQQGLQQHGVQPGLKRVTWPPPLDDHDTEDGEQEPVYSQAAPYANGFAPPSPQLARRVTRQGRQPPPSPPPAFVSLRQSPPIHQEPAPVVVSQPAAARMQGGVRARGDAKWPPQEYKTRADEENAQRLALAKGPVCRPRLPKRDYSSFFEQHKTASMYPGYRAPPGTQHYVDETGVSEF